MYAVIAIYPRWTGKDPIVLYRCDSEDEAEDKLRRVPLNNDYSQVLVLDLTPKNAC